MSWREAFFVERGFLMRKGAAYRDEPLPPCQKKLCITSTKIEPLGELLLELSNRADCWYVKLDAELQSNGMCRGRCFLTHEAVVAELWNEYKVTDDFLCTVQDDDWTVDHRPEHIAADVPSEQR